MCESNVICQLVTNPQTWTNIAGGIILCCPFALFIIGTGYVAYRISPHPDRSSRGSSEPEDQPYIPNLSPDTWEWLTHTFPRPFKHWGIPPEDRGLSEDDNWDEL